MGAGPPGPRTRRAAGAAALACCPARRWYGGRPATARRPGPGRRRDPDGDPDPRPRPRPCRRRPADLTYPRDPLARLGDPAGATLSDRPVHRALALYQPIDPETDANGRSGCSATTASSATSTWSTPAPTRDASGNEAPALKPGVLSPDGRTAAFAQTDELIVVDLTTAAVRRLPLDGYLELVVWAGDRVLVGGDDRTYAVDRVTGAAGTIGVDLGVDRTRPGRPRP